MRNNRKKYLASPKAAVLFLFALVIIIIAFILGNGHSTNVSIVSEEKVIGLQCENNFLIHPVLTDYTPRALRNLITATFQNDDLISIMYQYEGFYNSAEEARNAEAFAAADYNTILAKRYGKEIDIFSHAFVVDNEVLHLTINGGADEITSKTAPYFLLDQDKVFPKRLNSLKETYEEKGFSCKTTE